MPRHERSFCKVCARALKLRFLTTTYSANFTHPSPHPWFSLFVSILRSTIQGWPEDDLCMQRQTFDSSRLRGCVGSHKFHRSGQPPPAWSQEKSAAVTGGSLEALRICVECQSLIEALEHEFLQCSSQHTSRSVVEVCTVTDQTSA
jgi:hypothetical protein